MHFKEFDTSYVLFVVKVTTKVLKGYAMILLL